MPVGTRLVVAFTVEDNAFGIEVMAKADVLDGPFVAVEAGTGDAVWGVDDEPLTLENPPDNLSEVAVDKMVVGTVDGPDADALKNDAALDEFVKAVERLEK